MEGEFTVIQGFLESRREIVLANQLIMELLLEEANSTPTIQFGTILGNIGITDQFA
ncbi:hypothetical protein HORIV_28530 [Vreelandella olivaria]|uniref:Uncharacterized protein n=1 Tax=Vreelandella olivaria TaxID=390919 RepID=A0ABN5X0S9_9GAMM|nr:hypothetical protein HORIV_28530 [Halomonas olivaria]